MSDEPKAETSEAPEAEEAQAPEASEEASEAVEAEETPAPAEEAAEETTEEAPKAKAAPKEAPTPKKPLEKMTAKELREYALELGGIVGVHSMNKEELLGAIKEGLGISDEAGSKLFAREIKDTKGKIKELKAQRDAAREAGDKKQVEILRRRIGRLKKKTRRLSGAG